LDELVSLGERLTPLVSAPWTHDCHPHFKRDFLSQTGLFKDLSRSVMLFYLRAFGIRPSSKTVLATRARRWPPTVPPERWTSRLWHRLPRVPKNRSGAGTRWSGRTDRGFTH